MSDSISPVVQIGRNRFKPITKGQLVEEPGYAGGWYRKGNLVYFTQFDGVERVALIDNRNLPGLLLTEWPFFVTCRREQGSPSGFFYMNACSSVDEEWLGIDGARYLEQSKIADRVAHETGIAPVRQPEYA